MLGSATAFVRTTTNTRSLLVTIRHNHIRGNMPRTRQSFIKAASPQPPSDTASASKMTASPRSRKRPRVMPVTPEPISSGGVVIPKKESMDHHHPSRIESSPAWTTPSTNSSTTITANNNDWIDLQVAPHELRPSATLTTGQCFHWHDITTTSTNDQTTTENDISQLPDATTSSSPSLSTPSRSAWGVHNARHWRGMVRWPDTGTSALIEIQETPQTTLYRVLWQEQHENDTQKHTASIITNTTTSIHTRLRAYFQLDETPSLQDLYNEWSQQCPRMQRIAQAIPGVRILAQDPWECLISFICSSNNNIPRITQILQKLRQRYGTKIEYTMMEEEDETSNSNTTTTTTSYYTFPSPEQLSHATEDDLRQHCGLGYRAAYILQTTHAILQLGGEPTLRQWQFIDDYTAIRNNLMALAGVGPKVADCVALFSLRQDTHAIPVDTHVWNIALRDYAKHLQLPTTTKKKSNNSSTAATTTLPQSMTPKVYRAIQDVFVRQFPTKPAWAHSLLFVAELPSFRAVLPEDLVHEMEEVRVIEDGSGNIWNMFVTHPMLCCCIFCWCTITTSIVQETGTRKEETGQGTQASKQSKGCQTINGEFLWLVWLRTTTLSSKSSLLEVCTNNIICLSHSTHNIAHDDQNSYPCLNE